MAKYLPLRPNSIRLLRLDHTEDGEMSGSLIVAALDSLITRELFCYSAVSYVWGQEDDCHHEIFLNGWATPIRRNLWLFFSHLQPDCLGQYLWIDALCIDQTNKTERSAQVSMMSEIYRHAEKVIVWLGPALKDSDLVMNMCSPQSHGRDQTTTSVSELEAALNTWLSREYWHRTWIMQEFMLARKVELMCGLDTITGTALEIFLTRKLKQFGNKVDYADLTNSPGWRLVDRRNRKSEATSLLDLVILNRTSLCSEPRDRVFAMLGLCSEQRSGKSFPVDYSITIERLVGEVLKFCEVQPKDMCWCGRMLALVLGASSRHRAGKRLDLGVPEPSSRIPSKSTVTTMRSRVDASEVHGFIAGRLTRVDGLADEELQHTNSVHDSSHQFIGRAKATSSRQYASSASDSAFLGVSQLVSEVQLGEDSILVKPLVLEAINARLLSFSLRSINATPPIFAYATMFLSSHTQPKHVAALTYGFCGKGDRVIQFPGHDVGVVLSSDNPPRLTGTVIYVKREEEPNSSSRVSRAFSEPRYGFIHSAAELRTPITTVKLWMTAEELIEFTL